MYQRSEVKDTLSTALETRQVIRFRTRYVESGISSDGSQWVQEVRHMTYLQGTVRSMTLDGEFVEILTQGMVITYATDAIWDIRL